MKYLLDTDVISQYTKQTPDARVDAWIQRTADSELYISVITYAELWSGVNLLSPSKKRTELEGWIEGDLSVQFFNRLVGFDLKVAKHYGSLMARAKKSGHNPNSMDVLIAAAAEANGMVVATLNKKDFVRLGVEVVEF
jgi:predicted nucleic acid-binding protein